MARHDGDNAHGKTPSLELKKNSHVSSWRIFYEMNCYNVVHTYSTPASHTVHNQNVSPFFYNQFLDIDRFTPIFHNRIPPSSAAATTAGARDFASISTSSCSFQQPRPPTARPNQSR